MRVCIKYEAIGFLRTAIVLSPTKETTIPRAAKQQHERLPLEHIDLVSLNTFSMKVFC